MSSSPNKLDMYFGPLPEMAGGCDSFAVGPTGSKRKSPEPMGSPRGVVDDIESMFAQFKCIDKENNGSAKGEFLDKTFMAKCKTAFEAAPLDKTNHASFVYRFIMFMKSLGRSCRVVFSVAKMTNSPFGNMVWLLTAKLSTDGAYRTLEEIRDGTPGAEFKCFARGCPILFFERTSVVKVLGFEGKFLNDTTKLGTPRGNCVTRDAKYIYITQKQSGFLIMVIAFKHDGKYYYTVTTKGHAGTEGETGFSAYAHDLVKRVITPKLVKVLADENICIGAEGIKKENPHVNEVLEECLFVTGITKCMDPKGNNWMHTRFEPPAIAEFCKEHGLISTPYIHVEGFDNLEKVTRVLLGKRDEFETFEQEDAVIQKLVEEGACKYFSMGVSGATCFGKHGIPEGHVVHVWDHPINRQLVRSLYKAKNPWYTMQTMILRELFSMKRTKDELITHDLTWKIARHLDYFAIARPAKDKLLQLGKALVMVFIKKDAELGFDYPNSDAHITARKCLETGKYGTTEELAAEYDQELESSTTGKKARFMIVTGPIGTGKSSLAAILGHFLGEKVVVVDGDGHGLVGTGGERNDATAWLCAMHAARYPGRLIVLAAGGAQFAINNRNVFVDTMKRFGFTDVDVTLAILEFDKKNPMSREIAVREVTETGVDVLDKILWDIWFSHKDNVPLISASRIEQGLRFMTVDFLTTPVGPNATNLAAVGTYFGVVRKVLVFAVPLFPAIIKEDGGLIPEKFVLPKAIVEDLAATIVPLKDEIPLKIKQVRLVLCDETKTAKDPGRNSGHVTRNFFTTEGGVEMLPSEIEKEGWKIIDMFGGRIYGRKAIITGFSNKYKKEVKKPGVDGKPGTREIVELHFPKAYAVVEGNNVIVMNKPPTDAGMQNVGESAEFILFFDAREVGMPGVRAPHITLRKGMMDTMPGGTSEEIAHFAFEALVKAMAEYTPTEKDKVIRAVFKYKGGTYKAELELPVQEKPQQGKGKGAKKEEPKKDEAEPKTEDEPKKEEEPKKKVPVGVPWVFRLVSALPPSDKECQRGMRKGGVRGV